jgi:hypothetical protein
MDEFAIENGSDYLKISFAEVLGFPDSTSHFGGYDVRCCIDISSDGFVVKHEDFWTSTGVIYKFFENLSACNKALSGEVNFDTIEDLELKIKYDTLGHASIRGKFDKGGEFGNKLEFEFITDQTFIQNTLRQLSAIVQKYGGMKGVK